MFPLERKSVRVPIDYPSREDEIIPLERKSVRVPRDDPSREEDCKASKR